MEVVGAACELVPSLLSPLKEQINYVKNLKKNFTKLEEDVKALCNLKDDIEIARDTSKILSKECKGWTEKVDKFETEVSKIKEEVDENRRCLNRCCFPDICARRKVGKRVKTMLENVAELKKDADFKGAKYVDAPAAVVEEIPVPDIKGGETAVERTVKRIMQSIMDAKFKKIGLWGMGGVGKTTALENLNNHSEIAQTFEVVIWVTVSKEGRVRKVQNEIAERLKMNIPQSESDQSTARKLHEKLKTMKYLLLLDDLWSPVNLEEVGIPPQERSKVVLTTRNRDVCRSMRTDDEIKVECLSEEEAWNLFRENAGDVVDSSDIKLTARKVLEQCDGLPLAVVVIGRSLRGEKDDKVWLDAYNQLESATGQFRDTEDRLFERLKLSYDRLKNVERECFLYCALYPEDYEIPVDELVKRWGAEGFTVGGGMDSLDDADASRHTIVSNLVDSSLLERTKGDGVKMHDVLRDLALRIASSKFLVRAGLGIEECPYDEKEWEEARRISLMKNKLSGGLPPNPRCNELSTLLLNGNESLGSIPDMFFQHMPSLRVLDLNRTWIKVVPASVSNLVNLRGLYASSPDRPVDLPREIGALKKLEVLEVKVGSLPLEVRQLTSLRRLWVEFHEDTEEGMKTICSNGVISSLFQLEDLRICIGQFDLRKKWFKVVDDSRVGQEVGKLKRLTRLQFDFSRIECLEHFLAQRNTNSCPELKDFHLSMSNGSNDLEFPSFGMGQMIWKTLMWNGGERELSSEVKMSQIINQAQGFVLTSHKTATSLLHLGMENIQRLEECEVTDCPVMETIVESNGPSTSTTNVTPVLLNLKELKLNDLPNLRSICEDPRHRFTKLTELHIWNCPKLSSCVFTQGMIQHMPNLEELYVSKCEGIEEIVMREDVEETNHPHLQLIFFPKLTRLVLRSCPKLSCVFTQGMIQHMPNLDELRVQDCEGIEEIVMREDVEETNHPHLQLIFFPKLTRLVLRSCPKLSSCVFTQGMIQHMPNLEVLDVRDCEGIEEIVMREDVEETNHPHLQLIFFPKLRRFYLQSCPKLSCVFTQGMIQHMPNLEELNVTNCEGIEEIVMREDVEETNHPHLQLIFFPKLRELVLRSCPKLSCVFTQGMIQHMPNLEVLDVFSCEGIEEIVMREDVEETNHPHLQLIFFPKLRWLFLQSCPKLRRLFLHSCPSIQEIQVRYCPNLENLNLNAVDDQNPLAALTSIKGDTEWWEALKWEDENSKHRLQPFFHQWE